MKNLRDQNLMIPGAIFFTLLVLLMFGVPNFVGAEETASEDFILEDTVVTATKTGMTKIQDTPLAITAFSEEYLEATRTESLVELTQFIPNTHIERVSAGTAAYIRGIGTNNASWNGEQNVGFYVDGVYIEKGNGAHLDFFDVGRVEVLRGPQGTLYGRNSTGGAINLITKSPTDDLDLRIGLEIGSYSKRRVDVSISGPIVKDKVKARLTISDGEHDGYVKNLIGPDPFDEDFTGSRGKVQITPLDNIDILLSADYFESENNGIGKKLLNDQGNIMAMGTAAGIPSSGMIPSDFWTVALDGDQSFEETNSGLMGRAVIKLPKNMTFTSITAYRGYDMDFRIDLDGSPVHGQHYAWNEDNEQFSQEFQLHATWEKWQWLAGLYYYNWQGSFDLYFHEFDGGYELEQFLTDSEVETTAWAGFCHVTFTATDKLSFGAGLRYSYEEKSFSTALRVLLFGVYEYANMPNTLFEEDYSAVTPKFEVNYKPNDDLLLYAIASQGFKSGVLEWQNLFEGFPVEVDPELLWSYEVGCKSDWFNKRLRANVSAFYYSYTDLQVSTFITTPGEISAKQVTTNAAEASIYGTELELTARPVAPLTLNASISYLNTEFDSFISVDPATGDPISVEGNRLPVAPEWKVVLGAQYVLPLKDHGFLTLRGALTYTDDFYFTEHEDPLQMHDAYTLVNAGVRFETANGRWAVEAYGRNLTEEEYTHHTSVLAIYPDVSAALGLPRTYGLQLVYKY